MGEVVNLRKWVKARDKALKQAEASANRAAHGRTRGQKAKDAKEAEQRARALDQAKRDDAPEA